MTASLDNVVIKLLAFREHSRLEIKRKLLAKGFMAEEIDKTIACLIENNIQSDDRFADHYVNMRKNRGFGPLRIEYELKEKGIEEPLIQKYLYSNKIDWHQLARNCRQKKFGFSIPENFTDQTKQKKYLQYKGFSFEDIKLIFK